jgi:hypothetical protein
MTVCTAPSDSQDQQTASQLALITGCRHHEVAHSGTLLDEFSDHLVNMAQLTDGQYLGQCSEMALLPLYRQLGIGVLLVSQAAELTHISDASDYSIDAEALKLRNEAALEHWLWRRLSTRLHNGIEGPLFAARDVERPEAAKESLRRALAGTPIDERPAARISQLFLDQWVRRATILSTLQLRVVAEPRFPYLDRALVERLLAMPIEWRLGNDLQTHVLQNHLPTFCCHGTADRGGILLSGRIRPTLSQLKTTLQRILKRSPRPSEPLGTWLRSDLAYLVRASLLSEPCLERGVFHPDTLRKVVRQHLEGQRNHARLILAMMIFEIGHRWLLDAPHPIRHEQHELLLAT